MPEKLMSQQSLEEARRLSLEDEELKNRVLKKVLEDLESAGEPTLDYAVKAAERKLREELPAAAPRVFLEVKLQEMEPSLERLLMARKALEHLQQSRPWLSRQLKTAILIGSTSRGGAREEKQKIRVMFPFSSRKGNLLFYAAKAVKRAKSDVDLTLVVADDTPLHEVKAIRNESKKFLLGSSAWVLREKEVRAALKSKKHALKIRTILLKPYIPLQGKQFVESLARLSRQHATKTDAGVAKFYQLNWSFPARGLRNNELGKQPAYAIGLTRTSKDGGLTGFKYDFPKTKVGEKTAGIAYELLRGLRKRKRALVR